MVLEKVTPNNKELLNLLAYYNIGEIKNIYDSGGLNNINLVVETKCDKFLFKQIRKSRPMKINSERISFKHSVICHLIAYDFPTPGLFKTKDGNTFVDRGNYFYELYEYVNGTTYEYGNDIQLKNTGRILAKFHVLVNGFNSVSENSEREDKRVEEYLDELQYNAQKECCSKKENVFVRESIQYAKEQFFEAKDRINKFDFCETIIHGDLNPRNLKFQQDEVIGMFDYDFTRNGERIHDLSIGLIKFTAPNPGMANYMQSSSKVKLRRINLEKAKILINGYRELSDLTETEIYALPHFLRAIWIQRECWISHWFGPECYLKVVEELMSLLEWLEINSDKLHELKNG
jgi:Ser/Thr protein kinase RdoA (MazF antagonist)